MSRTLAPVFRALANPMRRAMLDALRKRPRTTGELADAFPCSRFAVMQHLEVLVEAGLVVPRREGRERWNHLNAVPLQRMVERWVRPYEAHWASAMMRLKRNLETGRGGSSMPKHEMSPAEFGTARIELEIAIAASPARVWKALVEEAGRWWPKDFYSGPDPKGFFIEARPGGRMYEDWGDGAGRLWATVIGVEPGKMLELAGVLTPEFGGPATTLFRFALKASGKGTVLQVSDTVFGRRSDALASSLREGWEQLFEGALKPFVEAA